MPKKSKPTYKKSGVDYAKIDPLKVLAQKAAKTTARNIKNTGFQELPASRGESAYVVDMGNFYFASITECLGTKALVADDARKITGNTYYDNLAQDTIAMAVNDILTVGARPISIHAYWATGSSKWFEDNQRLQDLVNGWKRACDLSGAAWGGGETPILKGVIYPNAIDLAASCVGIIKPKSRLTLGNNLKSGDAIVVLESSGIHANGLTLARIIAEKLPLGYKTKLSDGQMYGKALLKPTIIYASAIQALLDQKIHIHYISNITGHGFRKFMRHPHNFTYRLKSIPPVPTVLDFIVKKGRINLKEAYSTLNMGAGMAIFVPKNEVKKTLAISKKTGIKAYELGVIEKGPKQIIIEPLNITYKGDSLNLRV